MLFPSPNYFNDLKNMKIGAWNVMTLKKYYRKDILIFEFRRFDLNLLRVSETHIRGVGSMKLGGVGFFYSGRKDGVQRQGVELMMNKGTAKSCLGLEGVNNRILIAHLLRKSSGYHL